MINSNVKYTIKRKAFSLIEVIIFIIVFGIITSSIFLGYNTFIKEKTYSDEYTNFVKYTKSLTDTFLDKDRIKISMLETEDICSDISCSNTILYNKYFDTVKFYNTDATKFNTINNLRKQYLGITQTSNNYLLNLYVYSESFVSNYNNIPFNYRKINFLYIPPTISVKLLNYFKNGINNKTDLDDVNTKVFKTFFNTTNGLVSLKTNKDMQDYITTNNLTNDTLLNSIFNVPLFMSASNDKFLEVNELKNHIFISYISSYDNTYESIKNIDKQMDNLQNSYNSVATYNSRKNVSESSTRDYFITCKGVAGSTCNSNNYGTSIEVDKTTLATANCQDTPEYGFSINNCSKVTTDNSSTIDEEFTVKNAIPLTNGGDSSGNTINSSLISLNNVNNIYNYKVYFTNTDTPVSIKDSLGNDYDNKISCVIPSNGNTYNFYNAYIFTLLPNGKVIKKMLQPKIY